MSNQQVPQWADPDVPEESLDAQGVSRRNLIRGAGLLGAGFAAAAVGASKAAPADATTDEPGADETSYGSDPELVYPVGDHHVHSRYSHDTKYDFNLH